MAQFDPIAIKSGILTVLGTDTLRADRIAAAGLTITGPVSGDACQVSGALTLGKAVNTSTSPIVGIYDGESNSVVRKGVVVATMKAGVTLANGDTVWLSSTAGALTNVKPTADMLHEVGVVVDASTSRVLLQQKPVIALPASPPITIWGVGNGNYVEKRLASDGSHVANYQPYTLGYTAWWTAFDGTRVWSTYNTDPGQIAGINVITGAVTGPFTISRYPGLTFDGTYLWLSSFFAPYRVYQVDFAGNIIKDYYAGSMYPRSLCYDGVDSVWVCNGYDDNVRRVRCSDGDITTVALGAPSQFAACSTKTNLWVGCDAHVVKIRLSDNAVLGVYSNGSSWGGAPCYDGTRIWQAVGGDYLRCWNEADGAFVRDVDTGNYHGAANQVPCFDGAHIWVNHQYSLGAEYGWHKFLASDGSYIGTYGGGATERGCFLCSTASVLPNLPG